MPRRKRALLDIQDLLTDEEVAPAAAPPGAEGHRARIRQRLLTAGADYLGDHELIEMLLFALPRRDTKTLSRALLARFGSFTAVIAAPIPELLTVEGLGEAGVAALKIVQAAAVRLARVEVINRPIIGNWDALMDYLNVLLAREKVEHSRVLFLDNRNRLIADEVQNRGSVSHTPLYPREVLKRAFELHATAVLLVHNHPSGDPKPSRDDVDMTHEMLRLAQGVGITLHDHVIVGNGRWFSFRQERII
jgi:DNA repair protein RadC